MEGNSHFYVTLDEDEGIYDFALPGLIEIVGYKEGDTISFTYVEADPTNPVEEILGGDAQGASGAEGSPVLRMRMASRRQCRTAKGRRAQWLPKPRRLAMLKETRRKVLRGEGGLSPFLCANTANVRGSSRFSCFSKVNCLFKTRCLTSGEAGLKWRGCFSKRRYAGLFRCPRQQVPMRVNREGSRPAEVVAKFRALATLAVFADGEGRSFSQRRSHPRGGEPSLRRRRCTACPM